MGARGKMILAKESIFLLRSRTLTKRGSASDSLDPFLRSDFFVSKILPEKGMKLQTRDSETNFPNRKIENKDFLLRFLEILG